jgi:hypothetical protein
VKTTAIALLLLLLIGFSGHTIVQAEQIRPIDQPDDGVDEASVNVITPSRANCPGFLPSRLIVNMQGRVTPGLPNRLREQPSLSSREITTVPGSAVFSVLSGPVCDPVGIAWWQINYNGVVGWTGEGQGNTYWLEPYAPGCAMSPRLMVGKSGQVTAGLPNTLRSQPGSSGTTIGQIPGGQYFIVVSSPQCVDGLWWWQVQYGTLVGWTAEGQTGTYWLVPLTCPNTPPSQLIPGIQGRVTPGLPNSVRTLPGGGVVVGQIPGGSVFDVVSGPQCGGDGRLWWQVSYNGLVGWTAEGENGVYWLEPTTHITTCSMVPRLAVGLSGQVTPGLPNTLRTQPGAGSSIGQIPGGDYFQVVGGPQCVSDILWWQVRYGNQVGWTGEGQNGVYWLTPLACSISPASRLIPGIQARVTPGLPNALRSQAGSGSTIAQIPAGGVFNIVGGPQCGIDGRLWWMVSYGGLFGWTAEGEYSTYWLEPLYY